MNKSDTFFTMSLLFLGGALTGSSFSTKTLFALCVVIPVVASVLLKKKAVFLSILLALSFVIGILMIQNAEAEHEVLMQFDRVNFAVVVRGYVYSDPYKIDSKQYFDFRVKEIAVPGRVISVSDSVKITTDIHPEYLYGDALELKGFFEDGRIKNPEVSETDAEVPFYVPLYVKIFELKNSFLESVNRSIAEPNASYINGILIGERSAIPDSLKDAFQKTGMVHILAISGYNVTIVVSLIYGLLLLFLRRKNAFWFAIFGIFIFTVLTGASASVIRAAIMGSLVLLAHKEGRRYASGQALAFAAALMVMLDPMVIRKDLGFLLSFAATVGILYLVPVFEKFFRRIPEFYGAKEAAVTAIAAQVMVLPLLFFFFGYVSPFSVLVNVLVLPLIPYAMLSGFVTGIVGMVCLPFARIISYIPLVVTTVQIEVIQFFGRFKLLDFSFNLALLVFTYLVLLYILVRNRG